jgi:hypothetical protein
MNFWGSLLSDGLKNVDNYILDAFGLTESNLNNKWVTSCFYLPDTWNIYLLSTTLNFCIPQEFQFLNRTPDIYWKTAGMPPWILHAVEGYGFGRRLLLFATLLKDCKIRFTLKEQLNHFRLFLGPNPGINTAGIVFSIPHCTLCSDLNTFNNTISREKKNK